MTVTSADCLAALVAPDGSRVDRRLFHDEAVYAAELDRIFGRCWLFVGHTSQIQRPGDFVLSSMGEEPVIVTSTADGIAVLVNSCSHRGTPVCRADRGHATTFTCPYHGWTFGLDGRLVGVPHLAAYGGALDKSAWGLASAPRVEVYNGLIFASFDPDAMPLRTFLGDELLFYLDTIFDRDDDGIALLVGVHRWLLDTNWKLPSENQTPDFYHSDASHASTGFLRGSFSSTLTHALQVTTAEGHGIAVRSLPEDADPDERLPGHDIRGRVLDYFQSVQDVAEARLGPIRSRVTAIIGNVFPNFSIVPSAFTVRVNNPRGPGRTEIWSWCFVPAGAPPDIRTAIRAHYLEVFGPAGMIEQEDGENWVSMTRGVRAGRYADHQLHLGMGLGEEFTSDELPGSLATMWNEQNQRGYYRSWRRWMDRC